MLGCRVTSYGDRGRDARSDKYPCYYQVKLRLQVISASMYATERISNSRDGTADPGDLRGNNTSLSLLLFQPTDLKELL